MKEIKADVISNYTNRCGRKKHLYKLFESENNAFPLYSALDYKNDFESHYVSLKRKK